MEPRARVSEMTFVVGGPGSTSRLYTTSQLALRARTAPVPSATTTYSNCASACCARWRKHRKRSGREGRDLLNELENSLKVYIGRKACRTTGIPRHSAPRTSSGRRAQECAIWRSTWAIGETRRSASSLALFAGALQSDQATFMAMRNARLCLSKPNGERLPTTRAPPRPRRPAR